MTPISLFPISEIKIRIPIRRRELITRTRLIDRLYEQIDKPLLFVIAPAGYGKTSLLVDLSTQIDLPFCWLALDALDQEPQRFLNYLIASIAARFPGFGQDSRSVLSSMTSLASDREQVLVTITNEISARIHDHFVLVLDDYHFVEGAAEIGELIGRFLQLAGENVHIIISSRNLPDLPFAPLMIARNQIGGLSFKDLSFRTEEIQTLFDQNQGMTLSQQDAETLQQETEGWIAAIHLSHGVPTALPQFTPLISTAVLFDFFSREVMDQQPGDLRRFMLLTSLFDAFDRELCEKVLDPLLTDEKLDWSSLVRQVQAGNLFCELLDQEGRQIRYHHLFQHYLRSRIQYEEPALAWSILQGLAQLYEERQNWEDALQIYDRLNDYQNQARILREAGNHFISAGRVLTLDNWLKKLPSDLLHSQPALVSLQGVVLFTQGDQRQALKLFNQAEAGLRHVDDYLQWIVVLVRRAEVYRQLNQYEAALNDVNQILSLPKTSLDPDQQAVYAEAKRIKGLALFGQGLIRDSLPWLEEALQDLRTLGLQNQVPILETELGVVHRRLGEPQVTARYYASALATLERSGNSGWKARLLNNMGMLKYMTGELEEAHHLLQEAVRTAGLCGYVRIQTNALISLGDLFAELQDIESAYACYDQALTQATHLGHSMYIFYASLGEARLKRLGGDPLLALHELRQVQLSQVHLGSYERAFFHLEQGLCLLDGGQLDEARNSLSESLTLFEEGGTQTEKLITRLWHDTITAILLKRPMDPAILEVLPSHREWHNPTPLMLTAGRIFRWLKENGYARLFRASGFWLFIEQGNRTLERASTARENIHSPLKEASHPKVPRLEILTFGEVQVLQDGHPLELSDWQTREARELFLYLLQSPPRTKDQIAGDFWPDLSPARLKMRFKINIYRIRQALGQDVILFKDDRYGFNRSLAYTWDREKFDELFLASARRTIVPERIELLEQARALLGGQYLEHIEAPWAEAERFRYEERRKEVLLTLAGLYLRKGSTQESLGLARELLSIDPLLEPAHRLILEACAAQHDPAGLSQQYHLYQQLLADELGMLPSLEMRRLYERLLTTI